MNLPLWGGKGLEKLKAFFNTFFLGENFVLGVGTAADQVTACVQEMRRLFMFVSFLFVLACCPELSLLKATKLPSWDQRGTKYQRRWETTLSTTHKIHENPTKTPHKTA